MKSLSKIIFISRNHEHHAKYSGYDQLLKFSSDRTQKIYSSSFELIPYRFSKLVSKNIGPELYDSESFRKELAAFWLHVKGKGDYIHYLYGDRDYSLLGALTSTRLLLSATFHNTPSIIWERFKNFRSIERLKLAVAVSNCQIETLQELKAQNVIFIPHGIDINFWRPLPIEWNNMKALSVGVHMRDFEKQVDIAEKIKQRFPGFVLEIVAPKPFASKIPQSNAIKILSNLTDDELKLKYSSAVFQLAVFKDCTANNALLEGLACGLPVIASDIGGAKDYVNEKCGFLCRNKEEFLDSAYLLMTDYTQNRELRVGARSRSLDFDWQKITPTLEGYIVQRK